MGALLVGVGVARPAAAQFSPGRLSRSHAALEGSSGCLQCHEAKRGVAAEKCLACHAPLAQRARAGLGLHGRPDHQDCKICHVEHQGVEADLVWWGKAGRGAFDHGRTGYPLEGGHATLSCESCHKPRTSGRTFLGLSRACLSCHADRHRGTSFAGRKCESCHSQQAWKPASGFDHARTSYPLTGRHTAAACTRCHVLNGGERARTARQPGADVRQCSACHADAHEGRLGPSCSGCHTTSGWRAGAAAARFDHASTGYPLAGRHASVACQSCHRPGRARRIVHEACTDCHADPHLAQLADAAGRTRCEGCHDVAGFRPSRFPLERHQAGRFPLKGAHLAVACDACHRRVQSAEIRPARSSPKDAAVPRTARFRFSSTACRDCHADPHGGEMQPPAPGGSCEACHGLESWRATFDHARTRFTLVAQHARTPCNGCHQAAAGATRRPGLRFAGLRMECASCHRDPHRGQFARAGVATTCETCHSPNDLKAGRFDHRRDSAFKLEGAHARAACTACHPQEKEGNVLFVRYKPIATACRSCHAGAAVAGRSAP